MPNVTANGMQIEHETFGNGSCPPLLLIMGLGCQMIFWPDELCEMLANRGHYVIRFDNRDVGLSSKFEDAGVPDIMEVMSSALQGEKVKIPYTLDDMAHDTIGLLDSLNIEKTHICVKLFQTIGSPRFPFDEDWMRDVTVRSYDRSFCPQGTVRQTAAIIAHGNRKKSLAGITAPTLVIHGSEDPLVPVDGGKETKESIAGAELLIIDGMGHDLPREVWPQLVDAIAAHTQEPSKA